MLKVFIVELMFLKTFCPSVIDEWNRLKTEIWNAESFSKFRKLLHNLDNGCPPPRPIYNIFNPLDVKFLTRLRLYIFYIKI